MKTFEGFMKIAVFCGSAGAAMATWADLDPSRNVASVAVYLLLGMALVCAIGAVVVSFLPNQR